MDACAADIDTACRDTGFFFVVGHDVPTELQDRLDALAREFFAQDDSVKAEIEMSRGGRAWRGWFRSAASSRRGIPT